MGTRNRGGDLRTFGVEEELLLVDGCTGRPVAAVEGVIAAGAGSGGRPGTRTHRGPGETAERGDPTPDGAGSAPRLEREAKREQVEVVSPPCATFDELARMILLGRRMADDAARSAGARAAALGTSVLPVASHLTPGPRYDAMGRRFGITMREQLTCGFHVHVAVAGAAEGVAVLDRIRPWLPVLLALSGNSPFWAGEDTGFASYRYQAWLRWPSAGAYDPFGSPAEYRRVVNSLVGSGVVLDTGMVYFDARLSERYPTIEVRVADVCMDAAHAPVVAALVRALVETAAREWRLGIPPPAVDTAVLRLAMWSASRFGIAGPELVDPVLGAPGIPRAATVALLRHVRPALEHAGDRERVERGVETILRGGTGAERQRRTLARTGSPRAVVLDAIEVTNGGGDTRSSAPSAA